MSGHVLRSFEKQVNLMIFIISISLAMMGVTVTVYFHYLEYFHNLKMDIHTHVEKIVQGGNSNLTMEKTYILKKLSLFPFTSNDDVSKIKEEFDTLKNTSDALPVTFQIIDDVNRLEYRNFSDMTKIFITVFVLLIVSLVVLIAFLNFSPKKHIFEDIEKVSNGLLNLDLSHVLTIKKTPYLETKKLIESFNVMIDHLKIYQITLEAYATSSELHDFSKKIFHGLKKVFPKLNRLSIAEISQGKMIVDTVMSDSKNIIVGEGFTQSVEPFCSESVKKGKVAVVNDIESYLKAHPDSSMTFIYAEGMRSMLALPVYMEKTKGMGILFLNSFEKDAFHDEDVEKLRAVSDILKYLYGKIMTIRDLTLSIVLGFTELVEGKDEETGDHLIRMSAYSRVIAQHLQKSPKYYKVINPKFVDHIYKQAPLHDIGKVGVPDNILQKPGKLDDNEFEIMKTHTTVGYKILDHIERQTHEKFFEVGKNIVRSHHERWDGKGYPDGLKGEEIPLCARIVAVADVFDALTSERPYKKAFGYDESVRIIIEESGSHFDPDVVSAFIKAQSTLKRMYNNFHKLSREVE